MKRICVKLKIVLMAQECVRHFPSACARQAHTCNGRHSGVAVSYARSSTTIAVHCIRVTLSRQGVPQSMISENGWPWHDGRIAVPRHTLREPTQYYSTVGVINDKRCSRLLKAWARPLSTCLRRDQGEGKSPSYKSTEPIVGATRYLLHTICTPRSYPECLQMWCIRRKQTYF